MDLQPFGQATPATQPQPTQQTQPTQQLRLEDLNAEQSLQFIWQSLNKANKGGIFTIDESYALKIVCEKIASALVNK